MTNTKLIQRQDNSAPQKRYRTIMADPPWDILQRGHLGADQHYPLMSVEQIKNMPVADLVEDDAYLWLWVTNGAWRAGYDVMTAWGFTYRSPLTWVKPRLQLGQYLRNMTEHVLFGTRGRAKVNFRAQPTWFIAPVQEHSHKPEEQYAIIERVSAGPYLELFARRRQPGWDVWGNEIDSDVMLPGYPVPSDGKRARGPLGQPRTRPPSRAA
ncbi:MT-A70 family methyltransferase [Nocardia wallacei]|uniref:MT-A70 family methyltransferase n=1 Tax=Nocardia wallacei TaxID=480035 RepID=UPI002453CF4C|nr:MT-A70 family methyltransferase [Nocardia wallacei]